MRLSLDIPTETLLDAKYGNEQAFTLIVKKLERPIYAFVHRMIQSETDAADVTQDILVKLYTHIGTLNIRKKFTAWVFTIARKTVYDWLRRKRRRPEYALDMVDQQQLADPKSLVTHRNDRIDFETGLARLTPPNREILLLYYWFGYPYTHISSILNVPVNTVRTRLHRARLALAKAIEYP